MKKQLNEILFLIIGVLFLFTNCQKDDFEMTKIDQQSKIIYKKLAFRDLHSISSKTLKELENTISTSRKYFLERGINTDNKYIIDSSNVIYIRDQSGYSSYTFAIQPESNSTTLQNIIISNYTDGTSSTFLAEYDLNKNINEIQNEQIYNAINKSSYFNLKNSNLYSNRIDVGQAGELCVDIGYYQTVDKCEGELVTPGENP